MFKIAIDGPSGSGKSTLAKTLSKELSYVYVDTGAMYRAVGLFMWRSGIAKDDAKAIEENLDKVDLRLDYVDGTQIVYLNGEDVSRDIRLPHISEYASAVSKVPAVRSLLTPAQRALGEKHNVIMDGRDIGTVVFPDADVKIYLIAPVEERARRRYLELIEKGTPQDYEEVLSDMKIRDERDASRDIAPAKPADDAILLNNCELSPEDTVAKVLEIIAERTNK